MDSSSSNKITCQLNRHGEILRKYQHIKTEYAANTTYLDLYVKYVPINVDTREEQASTIC